MVALASINAIITPIKREEQLLSIHFFTCLLFAHTCAHTHTKIIILIHYLEDVTAFCKIPGKYI